MRKGNLIKILHNLSIRKYNNINIKWQLTTLFRLFDIFYNVSTNVKVCFNLVKNEHNILFILKRIETPIPIHWISRHHLSVHLNILCKHTRHIKPLLLSFCHFLYTFFINPNRTKMRVMVAKVQNQVEEIFAFESRTFGGCGIKSASSKV